MARKQICKDYIKKVTDIDVPIDSMFDIQVKRIHEYKRQFLNILGIIYRYKQMKAMTPEERAKCVPRVCIFGGKAYATYMQAKRIVRLINNVGSVVNNDPEIGDLLKVVFVPDYNVSLAETLIPASELSQHISTAGTEASGTSNMKFQMNGCLIIGTLDGANVEIRECVGDDNFFLFGITDPEVEPARAERAAGKFVPDARFTETLDTFDLASLATSSRSCWALSKATRASVAVTTSSSVRISRPTSKRKSASTWRTPIHGLDRVLHHLHRVQR